jgi:hypothetical protein
MSAGALATWRQFQTNQTTDLAAHYSNIINTEADTLPTTLTSGEYTILCQGPIVGNSTLRGTNGAYTFSVAYIFSNSPMGDANAEALLASYGSSGIEGACVVPSVFNDCTGSGGSNNPGSRTAYDIREGLDMMRDFAIPANNRALVTNTFRPDGVTKIFFSMRQ